MTLAAVTEILSPSDSNAEEYTPMDDQSEAARWTDMSGIGEVMHDEYDNTSDLHELGLGGPESKIG